MEWDSADRSQGDAAKYPWQAGYSHSCVDKTYILEIVLFGSSDSSDSFFIATKTIWTYQPAVWIRLASWGRVQRIW